MKELFQDKNKPTMNELVNWFQINFSELANDMKVSNHNAVSDEPNPYHLEDTVWTHTMMVCLRAEMNDCNKIVNISALLHDLGKPEAREVTPFENKSPNGTTRIFPKSGLKTHFRGHEGLSFYRAIEVVNKLENEGVLNKDEKAEVLAIISLHGSLFDNIDADGNMKKEHKIFEKMVSEDKIQKFIQQVNKDTL